MMCQLCGEQPAAVHLKQIVGGEVRELNVCEGCASKNGFDVHSPLDMADFLFGLGTPPAPAETAEETTCPACHFRDSDFRRLSRLGCPRCYEAFAEMLNPMIENMHRGTEHRGKVAARAASAAQLKVLEGQLEAAVTEQRFEDAARIRDRMQGLRAAMAGDHAAVAP
jgi:protein arginine kinase activator